MADSKKEAQKRAYDDKVKILRQKQGLEEAPAESEEEQKPLSGGEKIKTFWYYHKWKVIIGLLLVIGVSAVIYSSVTAVKPDYSVVILSLDHEGMGTKTEEIAGWFREYGEDANGDGEVNVQVIYAPVGNSELHPADVQTFYANQTALMADFQICKTAFYIVDAEAEEQTGILEHIKDFTPEYPESEAVVRGGLLISATDMGSKLGITTIPEGAYLAIRDESVDSYEPEQLNETVSAGMVIMKKLLEKFAK